MKTKKIILNLLIMQIILWMNTACSTTAETAELETETAMQLSDNKDSSSSPPESVPAVSMSENKIVVAENHTAQEPKVKTGDTQKAARTINAFATDLYGVLKTNEGNLFFSPYSISSALVMAYAGSKGNTAQQLATVLHLNNVSHSNFSSLKQPLVNSSNEESYQLSIANAIWMQKNFLVNPEFLYLLQDQYRARLQLVDFEKNAEEARNKINVWTEEKTKQKIKDLLQPGILTEQTRLVLTNAIYFKGNWLNAFSEEKTTPLPFKFASNQQVKVPTMLQEGQFNYVEDENVQLIELPYQTQDEQTGLTMVVLLPKQLEKFAEVEEHVTQWLSPHFKKEKVKLYLPKFNATSAFDLKDTLEKLGVKDAFDASHANFTNINDKEKLSISAVIHKAFIDVSEKGTEAAASTAVVVATRSLARVKEFRADHPFLFWIRDQQSGAILFMGRVVNPTLSTQ